MGLLLLAGSALNAQAALRHEGATPDGRGGAIALASGDHHSCGIRDDGEAVCWGPGPAGREFPPPPGPFIALSAGMEITCGLRADGTAACWGANAETMTPPEGTFTTLAVAERHACGMRPWGQLECWGDGYAPWPPMGAAPFVALTAGAWHSCGLTVEGQAQCWGQNAAGQLDVPAGTYTAISAGDFHTCALRDNGDAVCWGENQDGQATPPAGKFTAIAAGGYVTCGLRSDDRMQCWGAGGSWESDAEFVAVSAGRVNACGIRTDGSIDCRGPYGSWAETPPQELRFGFGALDASYWENCHTRPDGRLVCWRRDVAYQMGMGAFTEVAVGEQFRCGRLGHGLTQCWGDDSYGQLQAPMETLRGLAAGRAHACALRSQGNELACWGWNINGQATAPAGMFKNVDAGLVHSCGVTAAGEGRCWGYNGEGQTEVPVWEGPTWQAIQSGDRMSCGLDARHFIRCWGQADMYPSTGYFRALSVGNNHSCAIRVDGRLACWGANWAGQTDAPEGTYLAVSTGEIHSCAIRSDGARVCWGEPWAGTPQMVLEPQVLLAVRPNEWFHAQFDLRTSAGYAPENKRFRLIAGALPQDFRLDERGMLFGPALAPGRYPITVEGRDGNGFVARRDYVIQIDDTAPAIQAIITGTQGDNGWYLGDVGLEWSVSDAESDVQWSVGCEPSALTADTAGQMFHCLAESAGGRSEQMLELKRDSQPPHTVLVGKEIQAGQARFAFEGDDTLSGLAGFECSLDGAAFAPCASPVNLTVATGTHEFRVRAIDVAGNRDPWPQNHKWYADSTAPVIDAQVEGPQARNGWYVGDVRIQWMPHDPDSPLYSVVGCEPTTLASDSIGAGFTCTATSDGGTAQRTVSVKRDATAPFVSATAKAAPNAAGWYRDAVEVATVCSDVTSGLVRCDDAPQWLDGEGEVSSSPRIAEDAAGNVGTGNVVTVRIDRTAPTLAPTIASDTLLLNGTAAVDANARDALSGVAAQSCATPAAGTIGEKTVSCTATDRAGNTVAGSVGYRVVYGFNGFSAPVQNPETLNVIKAGRSIPLRWRVLDAQGAPVTGLTTASVAATAIACPSVSENRIGTYGGSNGQLQNLGNGYYQLDWMAPSSLRGACRRLELNLGDGVPRPALFKFN